MPSSPYVVDPDDPRAPSEAVWEALSEAERARVLAQLPSELPLEHAPEGDLHNEPKRSARDQLRQYFCRAGRRVYLGSELPVYYPDEPVFAPDLIAILDVSEHEREHGTVSAEGKGLDFVLEVTFKGSRQKDLERNVERLARLGVPEYFVLDVRRLGLLGYRLPRGGRSYERLVPQRGRWRSQVLGLDLALENGRVRFFAGSAALPVAEELVERLERLVEALQERRSEAEAKAEQALALAEQAEVKAEQAEVEAEQALALAESAEARARRAEAENEALRRRLREGGLEPPE